MSLPSRRWLPLLALLLPSCIFVVSDGGVDGDFLWSHGLHGSGVQAEEDRAVAEFRAIELDASATVRVQVGQTPSVHLSGDDNLLAEVRTRVANGVLSIDLSRSCDFHRGLEIVIGTPSLERFSLEGSGDVRIQGLAAERLKLAIEGSGTVRALGTARELIGSIEGSGDLSLAELEAARAELSIEGSGAMDVRVTEALHYSIEGSGSIRYAGTPELAGEVDGSGSIEKSR